MSLRLEDDTLTAASLLKSVEATLTKRRVDLCTRNTVKTQMMKQLMAWFMHQTGANPDDMKDMVTPRKEGVDAE